MGSVAATSCGQKHFVNVEDIPEEGHLPGDTKPGETSLKVWSMPFLNAPAEDEERG